MKFLVELLADVQWSLFPIAIGNYQSIVPGNDLKKIINSIECLLSMTFKGQKISKAIHGILNCPPPQKKRTKKRKKRPKIVMTYDTLWFFFVHFFGRIKDTMVCFRGLLTFSWPFEMIKTPKFNKYDIKLTVKVPYNQ